MAKKQKKRTPLVETAQYQSVEQAERTVKLQKVNMIRIYIGLAFAAAATCFTAYGIFGKHEFTDWGLGTFLLAIPAYLIGGGIFKALKAAGKIVKYGWFLIPVFPADILFALGFGFFAVFAFFCVPLVFVFLNYIEHNRNYKEAQRYLALAQSQTMVEE